MRPAADTLTDLKTMLLRKDFFVREGGEGREICCNQGSN